MPGNDFYQVVTPVFAPKLIGIDPVVLSGGLFDDYYASEPPSELRTVTAVHRVLVMQ